MIAEHETTRIIAGFEDHSLPSEKFTHFAHLVVGLHSVMRYGLEASIPAMRDGIKTFNVAKGGQNTDSAGYHETITLFMLHALDAFWRQQETAVSFPQLLERLQNSALMDRQLMLAFYSQALLFSTEARLDWVEPDRLPLTALGRFAFLGG